MRRIVVGVDGSSGSLAALEAAQREAELRNASLEVVCAWSYPAAAWLPPSDEGDLPPQVCERIMREALSKVGIPADEVQCRTVEGAAAEVLVEAAAGADLLVVGARGLGGFQSLLLGSVSESSIHHAKSPVMVVRSPAEDTASAGRVAVGIDGSEGSRRALRWAAEEARLRRAVLEVVHVWHGPSESAGLFPPADGTQEELAGDARKLLERETAAVTSGSEGLLVERSLLEGGVSSTLREVALRSDLLVVGSRGRGALSGRLLGSVSRQLAQHSPGSVAVIP